MSQTAPDGKLLRINKAFADMLGYTTEDIQELNFAEITHPDDVAAGRECLRILLTGEQTSYRFEKRYIHKNGNIVWVDLSTTLLRDEQATLLYLITNIVDITKRKQSEKQLKDTLESLRKAVGVTIQVLASAVETRDPYTSGHQTRSADLARTIAIEMGLPQDKIDAIRMAGSIHDIGKLSIPAEILSKPTKLSEIELALIKEHANRGYEMLKDVVSQWPLAEIVRQHHERMDG
ncbi:PAS domain S-box protein, partial [bacterium]